jgi:hypothetical protein
LIRRFCAILLGLLALAGACLTIFLILGFAVLMIQHEQIDHAMHWTLLAISLFLTVPPALWAKQLWKRPDPTSFRKRYHGSWNGYEGECFKRPGFTSTWILLLLMSPVMAFVLYAGIAVVIDAVRHHSSYLWEIQTIKQVGFGALLASPMIFMLISIPPVMFYHFKARESPLAVLTKDGICLPFVEPEFIWWTDIQHIKVSRLYRSSMQIEFILKAGVLPSDKRISRWHRPSRNSIVTAVDSIFNPLISAVREAHEQTLAIR